MHETRSFLKTVVERIRGYLDDTDFDAKYTDQFLVQHVIMPAMVDVWSRCSLSADNPVLLSFNITLVENQECYTLPPCVGEIHEVVQYTGPTGTLVSNGLVTGDIRPSHPQSVGGPNWMLEGNMICFRPFPQGLNSSSNNLTWTIRYTTNGDMLPHYCPFVASTTYGTLDATKTLFTLHTSPTLGLVDYRPNAYAGQFIRLLSSSNASSLGITEERVVASYDPATRIATLLQPFTVAAGAYAYEVCPPQAQGMVEAISVAAALKLGAWRKISQAHNQLLTQQYRAAIKTIGDNLANMNLRTGKGWAKDTRDSSGWSL